MSGARAVPPRVARWLLSRLVAPENREAFLGDVDEAFARRVASGGAAAARAWYRQQFRRSIWPLLHRRLSAPRRPVTHTNRIPMWQNLLDDVRYFLRLNQRTPLASVTIVLTMMLGIGVTTAVFSVVNGVVLRPLPFAHSDRVDRIEGVSGNGLITEWVVYPDLLDYAREARTISDVAIFTTQGGALVHGEFPKALSMVSANAAYARVFDLHPRLGRLFNDDEFSAGGRNVVILTNQLWQREFGGDPAIVGATIAVDNVPLRVVGVLEPTEFNYPSEQLDAIVPLYISPANTGMMNRGCGCIQGAVLRRSGVSADQARADVGAIYARIAAQYPNEKGATKLRMETLRDTVIASARPMLVLLSAAVAAVLLIACINVANLLLGQSQRRTREFAVRAALGGSLRRIGQQLITESVLVAAAGGILGALLAPTLARLLVRLYPVHLPRASEISVDGRALGIALLTTLVAGFLAGLPTARRASMLDLTHDLREGARAGLTRSQQRFGSALIVTQVALSVAFLFSAGLFVQTFRALNRVNPGFDRGRVLSFHLSPSTARHGNDEQLSQLFRQLDDAVRTLPGVQDVAYTSYMPFGDDAYIDAFVREDRGDLRADNPKGTLAVVSAGYERVLHIPLERGRGFLPTDDAQAPPVAMINDVLARHAFPGEDPVGHFIRWEKTEHVQIVGVLRSVHLHNLTSEPEAEFYLPERQVAWRSRYMLVKAAGDELALVPPIRRVMQGIDPTMIMTSVRSMNERVERSVAPQRFRAVLVATLGGVALALAVVGIYAVVASTVARQTREIGIRMALGEEASHVRFRVVARALRTTTLGGAIGVGIALAAGKWSSSLLIGVSPSNPALLLAVCGVIALVAALAAYVPARRASRIDPLAALRIE